MIRFLANDDTLHSALECMQCAAKMEYNRGKIHQRFIKSSGKVSCSVSVCNKCNKQ